MEKIEKYIISINAEGEEVASPNPEWIKHIQNLKYDFYLKDSGIPVDYWKLEYSHIQVGSNTRVVEVCKNYVYKVQNGTLKNLYLFGDNSTGKTTAMTCIGKDAIRVGIKVNFILSSDLLDILQKTSGFNSSPEFQTKKEKLFGSNLLLIDEVFDPSKSTLWKGESKNLIVSLIDAFFRHVISTNVRIVMTSNMVKEKIANDYSLSLYELIDRNFETLKFSESMKELRKQALVGGNNV